MKVVVYFFILVLIRVFPKLSFIIYNTLFSLINVYLFIFILFNPCQNWFIFELPILDDLGISLISSSLFHPENFLGSWLYIYHRQTRSSSYNLFLPFIPLIELLFTVLTFVTVIVLFIGVSSYLGVALISVLIGVFDIELCTT